MMPLISIGESLMFRLSTPITHFLGHVYRWLSAILAVDRLWSGAFGSAPCHRLTDLADAPILHPRIYPQARISMRSLLPLANRLRIMLRCEDEDCGGEALPDRWPAPSACSGTDPVAGTGATVVVPTSSGNTTTARTADGAADPAPAIVCRPLRGGA
jgi:hypothetical protein